MGWSGSAGRAWRDGTGSLVTPDGGAVPLEIAASYRARRRGLLGRDGIAGALLITPTNSVHTFGMRFTIDVAYLDRSLTVLDVVTMRPGRLGMIRPRGRHVLEAAGGAMADWGLRRGVRVTVDRQGGPEPSSVNAP
ncbi:MULTISPECIES: DUF192 domain-containing protein [unclassified Streptomyces]|uniref:DUF192 domain-containing protein n=1 Tax=unclassified Streptomyces TaxID=2593676 RepID=UPI002E35CA74|nr:DUF192 domain-containing protein [Streptomyces sp. NBC_01268]